MVVRGRGERDYPAGSDGKEPFCTAGDQVPSLDQEDLLEKEMTTQSRILAWKIPWTETPDRLQSMGSQRVGNAFTSTFMPF